MESVSRILIEQEVYQGTIKDSEDYILEAVERYINNPNPEFTLNESIGDIIQFSPLEHFEPLLEAADALKEAQKAVSESNESDELELNTGKKIQKAITSLKEWYFKIDPERQDYYFKTVINVTLKLIEKAIELFICYKLIKMTPWGYWGKVLKGFRNGTISKESVIICMSYKLYTIVCDILHIKRVEKNKKPEVAVDMMKDLITPTILDRALCLHSASPLAIDIGFDFFDMLVDIYKEKKTVEVNLKNIDANIEKYNKMLKDIELAIEESDEHTPYYKDMKKARERVKKAISDLEYIKLRSK